MPRHVDSAQDMIIRQKSSSSPVGIDDLSSQDQQQAKLQPTATAARLCLNPDEIYKSVAETGARRPYMPLPQMFSLGVVASCYLGFGFCTCMLAAGQFTKELRTSQPGLFNMLFGAYGFPLGLSLIVINGGNLVTGNMANMTAAFLQRRVTLLQVAYVIFMSYFINLAGCLFMGQLVISGDIFLNRSEFTIELAVKKCSAAFLPTFVKGIMCNWLVNMAIWQATAAQDMAGKLLGVWFPISAFVTMGFEHCVANMFLIPLAIRLGAPLTATDFIVKNLIPATLGNFIGGAGFVAIMYSMAYGQLGTDMTNIGNKIWAKVCSVFNVRQSETGADVHIDLPTVSSSHRRH